MVEQRPVFDRLKMRVPREAGRSTRPRHHEPVLHGRRHLVDRHAVFFGNHRPRRQRQVCRFGCVTRRAAAGRRFRSGRTARRRRAGGPATLQVQSSTVTAARRNLVAFLLSGSLCGEGKKTSVRDGWRPRATAKPTMDRAFYLDRHDKQPDRDLEARGLPLAKTNVVTVSGAFPPFWSTFCGSQI